MPQHFLESPLGVFCLIVLCATSLINIYAHWIEDGLVGRLLYMSLALSCAAGLLANNAIVVSSSLIILFMLTSVRDVCMRSLRHIKYRRTIQHVKKNQ